MGAKNILISMAGEGAIYICENVKVITNPTGTHVISVVELGR